MGFDFDIFKKISIVPKREPEEIVSGLGTGTDVEEIYISREPSIEEVLEGKKGTVVEVDEVVNSVVEEEDTVIVQENKDVSVASPADVNYRNYIIEKLCIDPNSHVEIYSPEVLKGKPLDFREIRDTKGLISAKVSKFELDYKMSCMPFSILRINKNVVEIRDYHITTVGNEKFVGSQNRITNQPRVDSYVERWKEKIECAEEIREDLMVDIPFNGSTVRTIAFNQAEIDLLLSLFNQVGAKLVIHGDKIEFVAGI